MRGGYFLIGAALALASALAAARAPEWHWRLPESVAPPPVPADNPMTAAKVELGRRLFYDADLSADGTMSCATCHEQHHAFADGNATRPGVHGDAGRRNVPGLANVGWFPRLTSADPMRTTLEHQAEVPVFGTHPVEMGMGGREQDIADRLAGDPCYRTMFARAFPENAGRTDFANVAKALASFQRTMISNNSAYDRNALSAEARAGKAVFAQACAGCHAGPEFSDFQYHRLGNAVADEADRGLSETTGNDEDSGRFRTAPLRNVALTAPYWHDGSARTLSDAIERHELGLASDRRTELIAFLGALTDSSFVKRRSLALPTVACGRPL